jgi:PGF-CTERM protein
MGLAELLFGICRNGSRLEMYDVNFGGTKHMTKRLTIALVAVALFVLMAVMPVSAATNGSQIDLGATVFIGEQGLNLTHALNAAQNGGQGSGTLDVVPGNLTIGWWASAATITTSAPTKTINLLGRYTDFQVAPSDFVGFTGNWYLLMADGTTAQRGAANVNPVAVMNVQDPTLTLAVWDFQQGSDVTGKSVPQGEHLGFQISTNMYAATYTNRNNTVYNTTVGAAFIAHSSGYMPDTTTSIWNMNSTGVANASFVETSYTGMQPNVYRVTNASAASTTLYTTYNKLYNAVGLRTMYWNNTNVVGTGDWTSKNYTSDANGVVSTTAAASWNAAAASTIQLTPNAGTDGFITIKVKDANGATYDKLVVGDKTVATANVGLTKQFVSIQPYYFGTSTFGGVGTTTPGWWVTDASDFNNQYLYPVGTYTAWAESALNKMKDNYKNAGADYTGKTVSASGTITLVSDSVKIEANKDSVVRSKSFSVTVTGKPSTTYYVWVKNTNTMTGGYDSQPPMININQEKVYQDDPALVISEAAYPIGAYRYENGGGDYATGSVFSNVADATIATFNKTRYYALINTSTSGTRTIEFVTNNWTKAQKYTIRVEQHMPPTSSGYGAAYNAVGAFKSDEVDVNVEKGAVTIVAAGDQSYYLGEEIKFSGTNTESYKTYLFIAGPNLPTQGGQIQGTNPRSDSLNTASGTPGVEDGNANSFKIVDVNGDNTWSWKWGTSTVALDAGTYTIYAVSQPRSAASNNLANTAFGTVSIIIKKPFVSATASQSTVAQGDRIFITGTAEGNPSGVKIWILGKNYPTDASGVKDETVNTDASFKYEVTQSTTKNLYPGQYFVVVQHPMQNNVFDVKPVVEGQKTYVKNMQLNTQNAVGGTNVFTLLGAGSLQGSDAAEALVQGINDPNVDDTYTKLQFLVEVPVIRIDPIGDKHVGDKFTITAATNLAVDDEVLVQVYSSSFKPTQRSQSGEFSGATGTIKVAKGDSGMNKLSFDVDSSTFKPDEYIVTEEAILQVATGTALFNVLEGAAPTAAPTVVVTTAAPVTAVPTTIATAVPTPIPTTKSPGYGALIALIGLGAVAFIVVRRH